VDGRQLDTVAVESVDPDALHEACRMLSLCSEENVSYPKAIRRVLGWDRTGPAAGGGDPM
jgi:hypothetical protein